MLEFLETILYEIIFAVFISGSVIFLSFAFFDSFNSEKDGNSKHYYTDDECVYSCYYICKDGCYGGHQCLMDMDISFEKKYRKILKERGRIGLWNYGIEEGFFKNDSDDYYGFFGRDYSVKDE